MSSQEVDLACRGPVYPHLLTRGHAWLWYLRARVRTFKEGATALLAPVPSLTVWIRSLGASRVLPAQARGSRR